MYIHTCTYLASPHACPFPQEAWCALPWPWIMKIFHSTPSVSRQQTPQPLVCSQGECSPVCLSTCPSERTPCTHSTHTQCNLPLLPPQDRPHCAARDCAQPQRQPSNIQREPTDRAAAGGAHGWWERGGGGGGGKGGGEERRGRARCWVCMA